MNSENITFLNDTLTCIKRGYYFCKNEKTALSVSPNRITDALVFLPEDIAQLPLNESAEEKNVLKCSVKNTDAFSAAAELSLPNSEKPVLVLNFANAVHPGGGVRRGSRAQEEDLCRTSTLLLSLESVEAQQYYSYNRGLNTYLGSDAIIVSPHVEVFRSRHGSYLEKSFEVSVLTCAAPDLRRSGDIDKQEYLELFDRRIEGIFRAAAYLGYKKLVLGAWGCGAFANFPRLVSDLFYKAVSAFGAASPFEEIVFAVPYGRTDHTNYYEFMRNFADFRAVSIGTYDAPIEEKSEVQPKLRCDDNLHKRIKGCLVGGAAGDALGYPVEFLTNSGIKGKYGKNGISSYALTKGKALISDDTQMLLFTAQGILNDSGRPEINIAKSYLDWYLTQTCKFEDVDKKHGLLSEPQLFSLRAPGNACLSALEKRNGNGLESTDFISEHINMSKGCGGIMRAAPCAFLEMPDNEDALRRIAMLAAQSSAVTHGHPLGYMSSSVLALIVAKCLVRRDESLRDIVLSALSLTGDLFKGEKYLESLNESVLNAVKLSENNKDDAVNLRKLGEGWVAEETLAVAVYCALKYSNDFSAAIIAAVNHSGDSDSTGAVTGNILGAYLGIDAIESKWQKDLELYELICETADKCSAKLSGFSQAEEVPQTVKTEEKTGKVMLFAGSLMEADRLAETARRLPKDAEIIFTCASPENDTAVRLRALGFEPKYSFSPEYISAGDYAAELLSLFGNVLNTEKPGAVVCVSGAECGFAAAVSASQLKINCIALSGGIRFDDGSRNNLMRSACDASALWRAAANEKAYTTLLEEGCEKGSLIAPNADSALIAETIKKVLNYD